MPWVGQASRNDNGIHLGLSYSGSNSSRSILNNGNVYYYTSRENRKPLAYKGWPFHHVHRRNVHRQKRPPFSMDLPAVIVVFIDILPNWGFFSIIKQICHASVGILMECLPSGGWFSLGLRPRENHPPSGRHSIKIPTLAWHICILSYLT